MPSKSAGASNLVSRMKSFSGSRNGVRIIATLHSQKTPLLTEFRMFKDFLDKQTTQLNLVEKSGQFYHNFEIGFTGIDCFQSSHVSVKTDPAKKHLIFDMFISHEVPNTRNISDTLYQETVKFFDSRIVDEKIRIGI